MNLRFFLLGEKGFNILLSDYINCPADSASISENTTVRIQASYAPSAVNTNFFLRVLPTKWSTLIM